MTIRHTIAHLYHHRAQQSQGCIAYYYPKEGNYHPVSHDEAAQSAMEIGLGLYSQGVRKGDRVAIISETRYEWSMVDRAVLGIGAVVVSIYPTSTTEQIQYILAHSGSRVAIIENLAQWEKLVTMRDALPELEATVLIDERGMSDDGWHRLDSIQAIGRESFAQSPQLPKQLREKIFPKDMAGLVYTSGTTGVPKGVVLSHENLFSIAAALKEMLPLDETDTGVTYLPLAHIMQRVSAYYGVMAGITGYYSPDILQGVALCQIANPAALSGVPRVYEKVHARLMAGIAQTSPEQQAVVKQALALAHERSRLIQQNLPVSDEMETAYRQFDAALFSQWRQKMFGGKIRWLNSGAAPISTELLEFFYAIGLPIFEGYGLTETSSPITLNTIYRHRLGTVGPALPGAEIKIADDGEILLKGPGVFKEYYKNLEATHEAITEDGWFRSGDIGELDEDGFLTITDRKKNLIITAGGKNIAPAPIENRLIQHPLISQAMVYGDRERYLVVLLTLDQAGVRSWAEGAGRAVLSIQELADDESVQAQIAEFVEKINTELAQFETIKYFRIIPEEFNVEAGTLTPTMKLKRRAVVATFGELLQEMYR